jgi:hypothetical protein
MFAIITPTTTKEGYKMEHQEFTKAQWNEEMSEARANGCRVMAYEDWVAYREEVARVFDELMMKDVNMDFLGK